MIFSHGKVCSRFWLHGLRRKVSWSHAWCLKDVVLLSEQLNLQISNEEISTYICIRLLQMKLGIPNFHHIGSFWWIFRVKPWAVRRKDLHSSTLLIVNLRIWATKTFSFEVNHHSTSKVYFLILLCRV